MSNLPRYCLHDRLLDTDAMESICLGGLETLDTQAVPSLLKITTITVLEIVLRRTVMPCPHTIHPKFLVDGDLRGCD